MLTLVALAAHFGEGLGLLPHNLISLIERVAIDLLHLGQTPCRLVLVQCPMPLVLILEGFCGFEKLLALMHGVVAVVEAYGGLHVEVVHVDVLFGLVRHKISHNIHRLILVQCVTQVHAFLLLLLLEVLLADELLLSAVEAAVIVASELWLALIALLYYQSFVYRQIQMRDIGLVEIYSLVPHLLG